MIKLRVEPTRPAESVPVSLADIVDLIGSIDPDLSWSILKFYGRGNPEQLFPGGLTYSQFEQDLDSSGRFLGFDELHQVALATGDIYEILIVGAALNSGRPLVSTHETPDELFARLMATFPVVIECVDSGYWLLGVADGPVAERLQDELRCRKDVRVTLAT